jgi:hydroxymethylbilane synthase
MNKTIRIGARGSLLALYQAEQVKIALRKNFPEYTFEIIPVSTKGDKILDVALSKIGDKGLFTKELENSLLSGEIDLAVHSLKDLPTVLPDGLILGGVLERGEVRDVLVSLTGKKIEQLDENDIVGTSSLRRISQLLHLNKKVKVVDIRGNVNRRLQKMGNGHCNALLLAGAGLIRLGMENKITQIISPDSMLPAVCQGIIGIEIRGKDERVSNLIKQITHNKTFIAAKAERTFLNVLEGGCQVPIGCYTTITNDKFHITGFISDLKGEKLIKNDLFGTIHEANDTAVCLAKSLLDIGGNEILNSIRK